MTTPKEIIVIEEDENLESQDKSSVKAVMGTTKITEAHDVFLIPTPTADPRDPLNLPRWRKALIVVLLSTFSAISLSLISGFGGLLGFYMEDYLKAGISMGNIVGLMTYPSAIMGAGNLICIPLSLAIGRRPVMLCSTVVLVIGSVMCAYAKTYQQHIGFRMFLGLAAGQSEALVGMCTQEIHFLHERSRAMMIQSAVQIVLATIYIIFASPIAGAIGVSNWYTLAAGLAGVQLVLTFFFLPETKYQRPLSAYQHGAAHEWHIGTEDEVASEPVTQKTRPPLDTVNFQPRTWKSDLAIFNGAEWWQMTRAFKQVVVLFAFPNVFWAFCLSGLTLGVNIAIGTAYDTVITSPPYNWPNSTASYCNAGQIIVSLVGFPLFGYGSDKLIKWRARRNGGVHEPEVRLILLWIPIVVGVLACVIFGQAGSHPERYSWFAIIFANAGYYFTFIGGYITSITYLLDSYPGRAGPILVIICALRGFIGFGTSYGMSEFIETAGYDGAFGSYAGLTAFFGVLGFFVYLFGKRIRAFTGKWAAPTTVR